MSKIGQLLIVIFCLCLFAGAAVRYFEQDAQVDKITTFIFLAAIYFVGVFAYGYFAMHFLLKLKS